MKKLALKVPFVPILMLLAVVLTIVYEEKYGPGNPLPSFSSDTVLAASFEPPNANRYSVSVATTAMTVQQPASGVKILQMETATVYCATASTITPMWNATTPATATAATIKNSPTTVELPSFTAWSGSNASGGTTGRVDNIPAGGTFSYDMSDFAFTPSSAGGTRKNFTFTTSNSCTISYQVVEK